MTDLREKLHKSDTNQERPGFDVSLAIPLARYVVKAIYAKREDDVEVLKETGVVPNEFNPDKWSSRSSQLMSEILAKIDDARGSNHAKVSLRMTREDTIYIKEGFRVLPILGPVDGRLRAELEADFNRIVLGQKRRKFLNKLVHRFTFHRKQ